MHNLARWRENFCSSAYQVPDLYKAGTEQMSGQGNSKRRRQLPTRFRDGSALANLDGRARTARAVREGVQAILDDKGGVDAASFLARRTALRVMFLDGLLSQDELALASGKDIDRAGYVRAAQVWLKYANTLGLQRVAKPAEDLHEYMRRQSAGSAGGAAG